MKEFTFVAWCEYGKNDVGESLVTVELTDEEAERLVFYGTKSAVYHAGFENCKELEDVYNHAYDEIIIKLTEEFIEFGLIDEDDEDFSEDWQVDETYQCGVNFPKEFKKMLTDSDEEN